MNLNLEYELGKELFESLRYEKILCEKYLPFFIHSAWKIIEPQNELEWNWHHELICEYLQLAYERKIKRLVINLPPRHLKSIIVSVLFPIWCWVKNPRIRFLFSSYSESLSTKHSKDRRDVLESEWFRFHWNKIKLATDQNVKTEFMNNFRGHMIATSMLGTVTGKGGEIIIIDDPQDPKTAESQSMRQSIIDAYNRSFITRINTNAAGVLILIMQRLHVDDLTAHVLRSYPNKQINWTHISLPAIAGRDEEIIFPISKRKIIRKEGEPLFKERESLKDLEEKKMLMGSYAFSAQYQQSPIPKSGGLIKRHWWKFYITMPSEFDELIQSWDCSFKDTPSSDFVCGLVWGRIGSKKYLLDAVHERLDFPSTILKIKTLSSKWPKATLKIIEEAANGRAVIDTLSREISGIVSYRPTSSKIARLNAVSPEIESGNVFIPDPSIASWVHDYLIEFDTFPNGKFDDMVDATTQALIRFQEQNFSNIISFDSNALNL